jgi:hypothetical protein
MVRGASVPKLNLSIPLAPQLSMKESRDSKVSMVSSFTGDSSVVSGSEYDYTEDDEDLSTTDHDLDNDSINSRSFSGLSDLSSRLGGLSLSAQSSPHKCEPMLVDKPPLLRCFDCVFCDWGQGPLLLERSVKLQWRRCHTTRLVFRCPDEPVRSVGRMPMKFAWLPYALSSSRASCTSATTLEVRVLLVCPRYPL